MIRVVLDTNVLVSAMLTRQGLEAAVIELVTGAQITPYLSAAILAEYWEVLRRPKFPFDQQTVRHFLSPLQTIRCDGHTHGRSHHLP
jgi:putative PIN family toxin of toxin-antitoxin system